LLGHYEDVIKASKKSLKNIENAFKQQAFEKPFKGLKKPSNGL